MSLEVRPRDAFYACAIVLSRCWISAATATERRLVYTLSLARGVPWRVSFCASLTATVLPQFTVWLDHRMLFSIDVNGVNHPLKLGLEDDPVVLAEVIRKQS